MKKKELIELLNEIARRDLASDANIEDHPCTLAASEIAKHTEFVFDKAMQSNFIDFLAHKHVYLCDKDNSFLTATHKRKLLVEFDKWVFE